MSPCPFVSLKDVCGVKLEVHLFYISLGLKSILVRLEHILPTNLVFSYNLMNFLRYLLIVAEVVNDGFDHVIKIAEVLLTMSATLKCTSLGEIGLYLSPSFAELVHKPDKEGTIFLVPKVVSLFLRARLLLRLLLATPLV